MDSRGTPAIAAYTVLKHRSYIWVKLPTLNPVIKHPMTVTLHKILTGAEIIKLTTLSNGEYALREGLGLEINIVEMVVMI